MRNFGGILLLAGIFLFAYASSQLGQLDPVPPGSSVGESLDYAAGRWELVRYAAAAVAGFGLLMAIFPKGR
jgi:hypothetical protein